MARQTRNVTGIKTCRICPHYAPTAISDDDDSKWVRMEELKFGFHIIMIIEECKEAVLIDVGGGAAVSTTSAQSCIK